MGSASVLKKGKMRRSTVDLTLSPIIEEELNDIPSKRLKRDGVQALSSRITGMHRMPQANKGI